MATVTVDGVIVTIGASALDLTYGAAVVLTIASGSVTRTGTSHTLTSESGSSDNLDLIAGGSDGDVIVIRPTIGHNITVRHNQTAGNTNNILLAADTAFLMDEDDNNLRLRYDAAFDTNGAWIEAGRDEPPAAAHTVASHSDTTATGAESETLTDGSDASALHVHTVVSLDTATTGAELTSLADGSEVSIHTHAASGVRGSVSAQVHHISGTGTLSAKDGIATGAKLGDASNDGVGYLTIQVPADFSAIHSAIAIGFAATTADLRWSIATQFGAAGQAQNAHSDSIATATLAVANTYVLNLDIAAALTGLAAGDVIGFAFTREGADSEDTVSGFFLQEIKLEYT